MNVKNILLFAGTTEGRELAEFLERQGVCCDICVATEYGGKLLDDERMRHRIHTGRLTGEEMTELIRSTNIDLTIDATHPYAAVVSENIKKACQEIGCRYLRLLREMEEVDEDCVFVDSVEAAVEYLKSTEGMILVATGSKELEKYTALPDYRERVFARVLSTPQAVTECARLGFQGKNLICMQGPFGEDLNYGMMKQIEAKFLVTKESGKTGGFPEKLRAARRAGARLVVVGRPVQEEGYSVREIREILAEELRIADEEEAFGGDPGSEGEDENFGGAPGIAGEIENLSGAPGIAGEIENLSGTPGIAGEIENLSGAPGIAETDKKLCGALSEKNIRRKITLIGIGMGNPSNMTIEARTACQEAQVLIGARRMLASVSDLKKPEYQAYQAKDIRDFLGEHPEYERVAILLSGDVGFYSGAKKLVETFPEDEVSICCGISSVVYLCGKLHTSWDDVKLISIHGRSQNLLGAVRTHRKVFALVGKQENFREMCRELMEYGYEHVRMWAGCNLSYPEEKIWSGTPAELLEQETGDLTAVLIENEQPVLAVTHGIPDEEFLRDKVPMTKSEVRSISLSKLELTRDSVVYDVGAGTGSVSVEMALQSSEGMVYAIEKKPEAVELIRRNKKKFGVSNLQIVEGLAPEALEDLPAPTHAFIGGSSGNLLQIMELLLKKNPRVRIVINAIALETVAEAVACVKCLPVGRTDIVTVSVGKAKEVGSYHMMMGQNPVYVVSCSGECR